MKTIIRAHAAQDFLAIVPDLAGFQPTDSIVLITFRGNRSCGALRVNLVHSGDADRLSAAASSLIGMSCKIPRVDAVVPVIYTNKRFGSGSVPPFGDLVNAVIFHAEQSGFTVRDALCVTADGWASYWDSSTPLGGNSLELIERSPANDTAANTRQHEHAHTDQNGPPVELRSADFEARERIAKLIKRHETLARAGHEADVDQGSLRELPDAAERALASTPCALGDREVALLLWAMQRSVSRDMLLLQWSFGADAGAAVEVENERFQDGDALAGMNSAKLLWGDGPRPDPERIDAAIELLLELVARSPRRHKAAAFSMLAWLNWAMGRGTRAGVFVDLARDIDAHHNFADIVYQMLRVGRLPEWAFAVPSENEAE